MDRYVCADTGQRLNEVRANTDLNAIDMLEVDAGTAPGVPAQRTLLVRCLRPLPDDLSRADVRIAGGVRADPAINPVRVVWAFPAGRLAAARAADPSLVSQADVDAFASLADPDRLLVVRTSSTGDFSTYRLVLVDPVGRGFDSQLAEAAFTFKVDCPSELDCRVVSPCPPERVAEPPIDYLSRDYHGLRGMLLDRLSLLLPQWTDRNAADLGVTVVELFAYLGDHLAYAQDAVAAEAYLGTARRRVSVRRHARLLDYLMHEGAAARTWLVFGATAGADGTELPEGTQVLDADGSLVFHTLHPVTVHMGRDAVEFHTWGDRRCCLPRGATSAALRTSAARFGLGEGDVLVFEEVLDAAGDPKRPDRTHRWAVRLRADPVEMTDQVTGEQVVEIRWHDRDALPFPLCLWEFPRPDGTTARAAVARGNVALAEHGALVGPERLVPRLVPPEGPYRPTLDRRGLVHAVPYHHERARDRPASEALAVAPEAALPGMVSLSDGRQDWQVRRDLLASDRFAAEYVVEVEEDGGAQLRFGDGVRGRQPVPGTAFTATYRVGGGLVGNTGRDSLVRLAEPVDGVSVTNPMPAQGGTDPESVEQVRQWAPQAFRVQQRAVSDADYAEVTERHPEVQRAAGTRRWTGSWYTEFVTVDRRHGQPVDRDFRAEMAALLERYRMAGGDVEVDSPVFVPLDIVLTVCAAPGYFRANVKRAVAEVFSAGDLSDGRRGFFHPDNFTFAQPVYLSRVIAAAMSVDGVSWVEATRFQRWGRSPAGERAAGRIPMGRLEVARCDSDPNEPENGRLELVMKGGL